MPAATGPYCLNVKLRIRSDQRDDFLKIILKDKEQSLSTEPGCLQFVVGEDTTTPNTFYLHEEYNNLEGFQAHTETPHFAEWQKFCDTDPWENKEDGPVVDFYYGTHTAPAEGKKFAVPSHAYCLNVNLYPKGEIRDKFLEVIANNKLGSDTKEPLCLQYVYGESTTTTNTYHFHEQYGGDDGGKEGFVAHTKAPHFAAWEEFASTGEPFTKPPEVMFYKAL